MTMTPKEVLDHLLEKFDVNDLFHPGPYNSEGLNGERIYLDETGLKGKRLYNHHVEFINDLIGSFFRDGVYICLATSSLENDTYFPKEDLDQVENCGIHIPPIAAYHMEYIDEDECFRHYILYAERPKNIEKYVHHSIANHIQDVDFPYWPCDIFLLNSELNKMVNIYDDRGMDIIDI